MGHTKDGTALIDLSAIRSRNEGNSKISAKIQQLTGFQYQNKKMKGKIFHAPPRLRSARPSIIAMPLIFVDFGRHHLSHS